MQPGRDQAEDTRALLRRLLRDEPDAWAELVREHAGLLTAVARRAFASYGFDAAPHDAEDAVAEVWRNLLANDRHLLRTSLERDSLLQTLHVLARNRSIDIMRRRKSWTVELREGHEQPAAPAPEVSESDLARLRSAIEELSPRERTLVRLFFLQRKRYREIAALTGIAQNSIGPTLARAVARLGALVEPEGAVRNLRPR